MSGERTYGGGDVTDHEDLALLNGTQSPLSTDADPLLLGRIHDVELRLER